MVIIKIHLAIKVPGLIINLVSVWSFKKASTILHQVHKDIIKCNHALGQNSRNVFLEESSFPPLPLASRSSRHESEEIARTTMAAHFHRQNHRAVSVLGSQAHLSSSHQHISSASSSHQSILAADLGSLSFTESPSSSMSNCETVAESTASTHSTSQNTLANGGSLLFPMHPRV